MSSPKLQALMLDLLAEGRISINEARSINLEIEAASTPPEGYVLVPVEATGPMKDAVESFVIPHCYLRTGVQIADFNERYRAMLAARPEVSGG